MGYLLKSKRMKFRRPSIWIAVIFIGLASIFLSAVLRAQSPTPADAHAAHPPAASAATPFFQDFLKVYMPRQMCMYYEQPVIWLHAISDLFIMLSYFSIPFALIYFIRRRKDMRFGSVFWMFAGFILACGTTHLFSVIDLWHPVYRVEGLVKFITASLSVLTAVALWGLMPVALAAPSAGQLEEIVRLRTAELEQSNRDLHEEARAHTQEIIERKQAEAALAENELQFRQLANTIPQLAWMAKADGSIFWYNERWHKYTGVPKDQMHGWNWQQVHDPKELPRVLETWKASLASGEAWQDTFPLRRHDGEFRWHLSRALPLVDSDGKIQLWFGTNTDITEQRQLAEQRDALLASERVARASAEHTSRMKDEFLATLSHELRTPLTSILGWAQILRKGPPTAEDLVQGLETIERNARAQTQLIEDLLDMSRIISGKLRLDVQSVDLGSCVKSAVASINPAAMAKGIRIEDVIDPSTGPISGDPNRVQQIIWNLLSNAVKFTPKNGKVQVILERVNSHVEITVTDTGQGIEPDFLPYVFERFRQADASISRKHGGLGLGLSIVKQLVELHGGSVKVLSPGPGQGSTFVVHFPLKAVHPEIQPVKRTHPRATNGSMVEIGSTTLAGLKVMIVDDETDTRNLIRRVLEDARATVSSASSAEEAMAMIEADRPDVLVSDIGMPDVDGYELLRRVRALPVTDGMKIPSIALTAFARSEDRTRALLAGFLAHVAKPVQPSELIATVASVAGRTG